ncbi:hypothetical protein GCM10027160_23740 [Streptomyces calidiresistens]
MSTTRSITADRSGPITIDASLLGHGGTITVRAAADCERATLTITTTDQDGPAADAVRDATLRSDHGLVANVQGKGDTGGTTVITGSGRGTHVVQNFGTVTGRVVGLQIGGNVVGGNINVGGGDVFVNGVRVSGQNATIIQGSAPIEITATVPEGSSLLARTHSADVRAEGAILNVSAHTQSGDVTTGHAAKVTASTQSGDVRVEKAAHINAKTQSGSLRLGRTDVVEGSSMSGDITISDFGGTAHLKNMSGDIRIHATAGGDITASTMSGDVTVTATQDALTDDLNVQANSMSGRVNTPPRRPGNAGPRRRRD